ncbi:MAG: CRTAC1 family protein [Phycisphaerales bacterium]|nr:MAG: CRTAC1 family protein [Phycisphaerales bacterium]
MLVKALALASSVHLSLAAAPAASMDRAFIFTDVTADAGMDFVQTIGDADLTNIVEATGVGCGFIDTDGDEYLDVYLVNGCWTSGISDPQMDPNQRERLVRATDRLYRNRGNGTFEDISKRAGIARPAYGMGVLAGDYDGDGDTDIYVSNFGANFLYRNEGQGIFEEVAAHAGVADAQFSVGVAFLDYDRDGVLDLYVGNYLHYDPQVQANARQEAVVSPLEYAGQQDHLYRGEKDGTFRDVTKQAGLVIEPVGRAMGVGAFDFDNDGATDIFVSNDAMENYLLHNLGDGRFVNEALLAGVAFNGGGQARAAMAVESGDFNNDGLLDMVIPDMHYGCAYRNAGGGFFDDVTEPTGVAAVMNPLHGWGSVLADFDLDGRLDLFISTGDARCMQPYPDRLFRNEGGERFSHVSDSAGAYFTARFVSRGVARGDFDNDGDDDLLVTHLNDRPTLLRNDTPRRGRHWLGVRLRGQPPNTDALGAFVRVKAGELQMVRQRNSAGSYLSQHDHRLLFGLGQHPAADTLEVTWPDGSKEVLTDVPGDRYVTLRQNKRPAHAR